MAESFNGLYKGELNDRQGRLAGPDDVGFATTTDVGCFIYEGAVVVNGVAGGDSHALSARPPGHSRRVEDARLRGVIEVAVPQYHELMFPVLEAVKALGESATNDEMQKAVVEALALTEQQQLMHTDSRLSEIEFRAHWAKSSSSRDWRAREQQTRVC